MGDPKAPPKGGRNPRGGRGGDGDILQGPGLGEKGAFLRGVEGVVVALMVLGERANQGAGEIPQPTAVGEGPFSIESDSQGLLFTFLI